MNINATVIVQSLTFFSFVALCRRYIWPSIISVIEQRQIEQQEGAKRARQGEKLLEKAQQQYDLTTHEAHQQYQEILNNAEKEYKKRLGEAIVDGEAAKASLLEQARAEIEQERKKSHSEAADEMAGFIRQALSGILSKLPAEEQLEHMIDEAIQEMPREDS